MADHPDSAPSAFLLQNAVHVGSQYQTLSSPKFINLLCTVCFVENFVQVEHFDRLSIAFKNLAPPFSKCLFLYIFIYINLHLSDPLKVMS